MFPTSLGKLKPMEEEDKRIKPVEDQAASSLGEMEPVEDQATYQRTSTKSIATQTEGYQVTITLLHQVF